MVNYLTCIYDEYSSRKLEQQMEIILNRLINTGRYEKEFLLDVVEKFTLDKWSRSKIVAYLDILDVEDRT